MITFFKEGKLLSVWPVTSPNSLLHILVVALWESRGYISTHNLTQMITEQWSLASEASFILSDTIYGQSEVVYTVRS